MNGSRDKILFRVFDQNRVVSLFVVVVGVVVVVVVYFIF